METGLKEKLRHLEEQVAAIKDKTLRRVAFEKLLDGVVAADAPQHRREQQSRPRNVREGGGKSSRGKNKTSAYYSLAQVRDEVQKLALSGTVKGLPQFKDARKEWEKYLWVLAASKRLKIDGLSNHEIAYLMTKRLYKPTKYSTVNNIHKKVSAGLVFHDPETQRWVITPDGDAHLHTLTAA